MCNLINTHTHTHPQVSLIPPWEDQCEWHRMTRMTGPDCAVMCNLINTHTHIREHRMTRMTGPNCAVMCNLINTHTHTHTQSNYFVLPRYAAVVQYQVRSIDSDYCYGPNQFMSVFRYSTGPLIRINFVRN